MAQFLTYSMRSKPAPADSSWFRIENKKNSGPAKVYIYDEIGMWGVTAREFTELLAGIDADEIDLHISSPGGSVFDALAIYATLKNHKAKVTGYVDAVAASAASFILQAADTRISMRNATIMIHDARAGVQGTADEVRKAADLLDKVSDNIADIYAVRSGEGTVDTWREVMRDGDTWYSGNEALDAGLVDEVIDNPAEDDDTENSWSIEELKNFFDATPDELETAGNLVQVHNVNTQENDMTGNGKTPPKAPALPPIELVLPKPVAPAAPTADAPIPEILVRFAVASDEGVVIDWKALETHVATLEAFRTETITATRKEFVASLAKEGKILAGDENLTQTETFALSLSADQFAAWRASMESAPVSPLFANQGVQPTGTPASPVDAAVADRIAVLRGIVQSHRDSGIPQSEIETKASYKELIELESKQASA